MRSIQQGKGGEGLGKQLQLVKELHNELQVFFFLLKTYILGSSCFMNGYRPDTQNAWDSSEGPVWVSCDIWLL